MSSLRSRLFLFVLRHAHLLRFQRKGITIDWNTSIPELRQKTARPSGLFGRLPKGIEVAPAPIDGVPAEWIRPVDGPRDAAILYFHGGGYVIGTCEGHRPIVAKFVRECGLGALLFGYRLAPEHPFPAALDDALTAYQWLLDQDTAPSRIVFIGDSAGGGLCLATLLALRDKGMPLPGGAVALSPWTDLRCSGLSLITNRHVDLLSWKDSWTVFSKHYAGDTDPSHPWMSPLYGDLHGLPPLLLTAGNDEVLRDDATRFAARARRAGVDTTLILGPGLFHCYPVCAPLFPEATEAMKRIGEFVRARI